MKRVEKDTGEWGTIELPVAMIEFLSHSDRVVLFAIGDEADAENQHVGLFQYAVRNSDFPDFTLAIAEFQKRLATNILVEARRTMAVVAHLNSAMLVAAQAAEQGIMDVSGDARADNLDKMVGDLVGLLGDAVGSLNSLNLLTWDPADPLGGLKTKECSDVDAIADALPPAAASTGDGTGPDGASDGDAGNETTSS